MDGSPAATAVNRSTVAALIPAYYEEKHIGDVVRRTLQQLDSVLVIDDGSADATATNARAAGAEVLVHEKNLGKGEAIKTGLRHWLERGFEQVIILDGDGQHLPEEINRFLAASASGAELLVGTRMNDVREMPFVRRIVNRYMSGRISRLCGQNIPDTQCGFRLLRATAIPLLLGGTERFEYETEMLIKVSRGGFRVESVPISTVYSDEVSSIHPVRDTIRFIKLMRRYEKAP
ncbi:MAG TPA: glycosyltransferase family 2 protein [Chthoniobacterales bacterium]|nr:glycosyltransferase family 2 protein [Chthoniobacterales bacterium]